MDTTRNKLTAPFCVIVPMSEIGFGPISIKNLVKSWNAKHNL